VNQCQLMGRLTKNPELRITNQGVPVASFALAIPRRGSKDCTDFIDIVAWRKTAEFCTTHFRRGSRVVVVGSIQVRTWEDKEGQRRRAVEVVAESVYFADTKKNDHHGDMIGEGFYTEDE